MSIGASKAGPALIAGLLAASLGLSAAWAADLDPVAPPDYAAYGVDCQGAEVKTFGSVWLGHFTGGASGYTGPGGRVLLDWRDEKLCFPSRRSCDLWVASLRRDFHHPEGYFTCLTIR